jgi:putative DNA modification/repair radical SAM protein
MGNAALPGICHSFTQDGRCISLLKILFTNQCIYDCAYCINRRSNDAVKRTAFTPEEVVDLVLQFYRRNYIEGLFLSSGIIRDVNYTMEQLIEVAKTLRERERFGGYIHIKGIPGSDPKLIERAGLYVDRMSINVELPTTRSLRLLAPDKKRIDMIEPMKLIREKKASYSADAGRFKHAPEFLPAGQTTQLIVGATDEADYSIIKLSEAFYGRMAMKRVYYSSYVPVGNFLAPIGAGGPMGMLREHRLYQADWLLRFYDFRADEILTPESPNLDMAIDPKTQWALRNRSFFPMEINRVSFKMLLRIPGIGNVTARRIMAARRFGPLDFDMLKKMGVVMKRAKYFILCKGKPYPGIVSFDAEHLRQRLIDAPKASQLSIFDLYSGGIQGGERNGLSL